MLYLYLIRVDLHSGIVKMLWSELPSFCHQITNAQALEVKDSCNFLPQVHYSILRTTVCVDSEHKTRKLLLNIANKYRIHR